jgi:hypothetical protein
MKQLVQAMHKTWYCKCEGATIEEAAKTIGCNVDELEIVNVYKGEEIYLRYVPKEFWSALSSMAYQRGHSAGEDECMSNLHELVFDLKDAIDAFEKRLLSK